VARLWPELLPNETLHSECQIRCGLTPAFRCPSRLWLFMNEKLESLAGIAWVAHRPPPKRPKCKCTKRPRLQWVTTKTTKTICQRQQQQKCYTTLRAHSLTANQNVRHANANDIVHIHFCAQGKILCPTEVNQEIYIPILRFPFFKCMNTFHKEA